MSDEVKAFRVTGVVEGETKIVTLNARSEVEAAVAAGLFWGTSLGLAGFAAPEMDFTKSDDPEVSDPIFDSVTVEAVS